MKLKMLMIGGLVAAMSCMVGGAIASPVDFVVGERVEYPVMVDAHDMQLVADVEATPCIMQRTSCPSHAKQKAGPVHVAALGVLVGSTMMITTDGRPYRPPIE